MSVACPSRNCSKIVAGSLQFRREMRLLSGVLGLPLLFSGGTGALWGSNEWIRPPDEIDDPISIFFSEGESEPYTPGITLSHKSIQLKNPTFLNAAKNTMPDAEKRRSKMPVDGFLRYRQGDLIPLKFKIFRPRGFFSRIISQRLTFRKAPGIVGRSRAAGCAYRGVLLIRSSKLISVCSFFDNWRISTTRPRSDWRVKRKCHSYF